MRLSDEQLHRLAEGLIDSLTGTGVVRAVADRARVVARAEAIIRDNLTQEQDLDRQARELLELHLQKAPAGVDRQKLFHMIKKKLAEDKGIPL